MASVHMNAGVNGSQKSVGSLGAGGTGGRELGIQLGSSGRTVHVPNY